MVRWPTSSSGACFCSLLVGCVVGCFRFSFFRALFCIDQLEPWNQIDVFGFKGRAMGLVFCLLPKTSHIDVLAVRRLLERPGLATCVAALARYRKSRAGQLGHAPGDAYDITKDHAWLFD